MKSNEFPTRIAYFHSLLATVSLLDYTYSYFNLQTNHIRTESQPFTYTLTSITLTIGDPDITICCWLCNNYAETHTHKSFT